MNPVAVRLGSVAAVGPGVFTEFMSQTDEIHAMDELADRLRSRFPDARPDRIKQAVAQVHHQYDGSPIRDFIPVLVEREVVDQLRSGKTARA